MKSATLSTSVYGNLMDRYLFNFRIDPDVLGRHLPSVKWLRPRVINGSGVVSFCLLRLEGVTLWPMPSFLGFDTISCAYRCAVVDSSGPIPVPSVYVLGRNTNLRIASSFGSILFSGKMKLISTSIQNRESSVEICANFLEGQKLFCATVRRFATGRDSKLFGSLDAFVDFIKGATSSYAPASRDNHYSRVDLAEDSNYYETVEATIDYSWLDEAWPEAELVFDSAFRASGGRYRLKYLGSRLGQPQHLLSIKSRGPGMYESEH